MTIVGRADYPAKDFAALVADLKVRGDKVNYANVGLGSASHLCGLLLMSAIGTQLTWVHYKGGAPALNDLVAGHVDVYCEPATGTTPRIQSGQIKGYAVTTRTRVKSMPDLPTAGRGRPARLRGIDLVWPACAGRHSGPCHSDALQESAGRRSPIPTSSRNSRN